MPAIRKIGFMTKTKKVALPKRFLFFDTETYVIEDDSRRITFPLRLGIAIYIELNKELKLKQRETYIFRNVKEFIDIINLHNKAKGSLHLFAHNIGFDIRVLRLPFEFADLGWTNEPPIINNRVFIWKVKTHLGSLTFLDTANYGVISVKQLGDDLGFPKGEVDFNTDNEDELIKYCIRDTEIIERFIVDYLKFIEEHSLGGFKSTLASQSLAAFRTSFMNNPPFIHTDEKTLLLERDAYHGGRVECFKIGKFTSETYYNVDVNSMYPYSMTTAPLPERLRGYSENVPVNYLPVRLKQFYVIADVTLETDKPIYCLLQNHKLIFPIGKFRTVLCQPELELAVKYGHIKQIHRCSVYDKRHIFNEYVEFFYSLKKRYTIEGNMSYREISKLFLNSLYGKFGQENPIRKILSEGCDNEVWRLPVVNLDTGEKGQEIGWFGRVFYESKSGETATSSPAIAAAITAMSRITLWRYIEIAGIENVFYMDTDSLIVNSAGYNNLIPYIDKTELGKLKLEGETNYLVINNNKDYEFGDKMRFKGLPKKAKLLRENLWEYVQFEGFISWLNNRAETGAIADYATKSRKSKYDKGLVGDDGFVRPYILEI